MRTRFRSNFRSSRREEAYAYLPRCQSLLTSVATIIGVLLFVPVKAADEFSSFVKPLLTKHCSKCHGGEKVKGKVNLKEISDSTQFLTKTGLIKEMIEVIEARDMPPEDEPQLTADDRIRLLAVLKRSLLQSALLAEKKPEPIRRLNRFHNNAIRDLFQLDRDVFHLQEKLMTRRSDYLSGNPGVMPEQVEVECLSLTQRRGMQWVEAFPKDLRATHGFDNQANQLTLATAAGFVPATERIHPRKPGLQQANRRHLGRILQGALGRHRSGRSHSRSLVWVSHPRFSSPRLAGYTGSLRGLH